MGKKFIADYYDHYKPFDQLTTIGLETQDQLELSQNWKYHVRIDRLSKNKEGVYYICDYKTNSQLKAQEELDQDRQLAMYSLWVRQRYPDAKDVKLMWFFLAFDQEMISERNTEQLQKLKLDTESLIKEIEACENFPTEVNSLCNWCVYKSMCPAWKHDVELEAKTPKQFKDDDGVKLVDELAKLDSEKKITEDRIYQIKEDLIKFAQQKDLSVVFGTDNKATVKPYDKIEYPKTEEFVELLKKKGLFEELAVLNYSKFLSKILKREVDTDVLREIKTEQGWMVRLGKRKE
ncbi:PD-(D/E)XK nuclease family protein [Candidatus Woesearchaeota archaeon]|nr:PD-(D/E)XK nuclease family protein [Candidatus Woesearchaeota archaeon]